MAVKHWIEAIRPRTLPLAMAHIAMGNVLASVVGIFDWTICILSMLTAVLLQILSNLANDYGDSIHGADSDVRLGPQRSVQAGVIAPGQMKAAIAITAAVSLLTGLSLIIYSLESWLIFLFFLVFGLLSLWAAINYTAGDSPYGYKGLGDLAVFLFFGLLAVKGSFYLQTKFLDWSVLLPATSCGLFSIAVLNVNNIRDIESDKAAGKESIPVKIGRSRAIVYQQALLLVGLASAAIYMLIHYQSLFQFMFLIIIPLLILNVRALQRSTDPAQIDPYLKQMALTNVLFVITFAVGLMLSI